MSGTASSRTALVTIGATAGFRELLDEVASAAFRRALADRGYTDLLVQCGPDETYFGAAVAAAATTGREQGQEEERLRVDAFAYTDDMEACMRRTARSGSVADCGVIICHAGSGTVLSALDYDTKVITVPNPTLMDNHQAELAEELEEQGYVVHGKLGKLVEAIEFVEHHPLKRRAANPPEDSAFPHGLWGAINGLMPQGRGRILEVAPP
ncbi:glycosyltransferase family 28 C-terminal domain-containing protein [Xylariaceae sp. FL0804]|nr:glycosyltransferase family 28 C-terminal domain-containing protein [Xylariaceae sp. FL0804]